MTPEFLEKHFDPKTIEKTLNRVTFRWKQRPNGLQYNQVFGESPMGFMNALRGFLGLRPLLNEKVKSDD